MRVLVVLLLQFVAQAHSTRRHLGGHETPLEGDSEGLARALSGNEVEKADVMNEVLPPRDVERARADLEMAATEEDAAQSRSSPTGELGADILNIANMQQDAQHTANEQAGRNQKLAEEDQALVKKVKHLRHKNHMLKKQVKLAKVDLEQSREKMATKVKQAFQTFLTNTRLLRDELKRDGEAFEKDSTERAHMKDVIKVQGEEITDEKHEIEGMGLARKAADAKAKDSNNKWQRLVVNLTDSFDADETVIATLKTLQKLDGEKLDQGAKALRAARKDATEKESALAEKLAKTTTDRDAFKGALADETKAAKMQAATAEAKRVALQKEEDKLKAENDELYRTLVQKDHESVAAREELAAKMGEEEKQYKAEMGKMTTAFAKAGQDIAKIEGIDRGLVKSLNSTRTERNQLRTEVKNEKAENLKLTNQTKTLLASNRALLEKLKVLKEKEEAAEKEAAAEMEADKKAKEVEKVDVEAAVAEERASQKRERETADLVAAEQAAHSPKPFVAAPVPGKNEKPVSEPKKQ